MFSADARARSTAHRELTQRCGVPRSKFARGFTLIELLTTVVVAAILVTIAVPSMRGFLLNGRIRSVTDDLAGALNLARTEAVKSRSPVTVCVSDAARTQCSGTDWSTGWIVWVDRNGNNAIDNGEIIRSTPPLANATDTLQPSITVTTNPVQSSIRFQPDGSTNVGNQMLFDVCDSVRTGEKGREIQSFFSGMVTVIDKTCN